VAAAAVLSGPGAAGHAATTLTISATSVQWVEQGNRVGITATTVPFVAGLRLALQRQQRQGWVTIATARARSDHDFLFVTRPRTPGIVVYRVIRPASGTTAIAASAPLYVRVLVWTYLSTVEPVDGMVGGWDTSPATVDGMDYQHPINMHGDCSGDGDGWLDYNLEHRYEVLDAHVGVRDDARSGSTATYAVLVDGRQVAAGNLSLGAAATVHVVVDGGFRVRLLVNTPGAYCPTVSWGDARILGPPSASHG
jgi:hypothetical protein